MNKSSNPKSYFTLIIVAAGFAFFCYNKLNKDNVVVPLPEAKLNNETEVGKGNNQGKITEQSHSELTEANTTAKIEPAYSVSNNSAKPSDPLLNTIKDLSRRVIHIHRERMQKLFNDAGKPEYYEKYLNLKQERDTKIAGLLTTNNTRDAMVKINYEYHAKLQEIIGSDLYKKYLQELKDINNEAKATKIVIEF